MPTEREGEGGENKSQNFPHKTLYLIQLLKPTLYEGPFLFNYSPPPPKGGGI